MPKASDAVSGPGKATELLDVEVDQLARPVALVAANRLRWRKIAQPTETMAPQDSTDRSGRDSGLGGDLLASPALAPEGDNVLFNRGWRPIGRAMRPGRAVLEAGDAFFPVAHHPFADGLFANAKGPCDGSRRLPFV